MISIRTPYLIFLGDAGDDLAAKTAFGIADWRSEMCVGQLRLKGCKTDVGLKDISIEEAVAAGAKTLIIGVANAGGVIPDHWIETLDHAVRSGLDIANGMHQRLMDIPQLVKSSKATGQTLTDVRHTNQPFDVGTGAPRTGWRILTVGTDCSVGKMYTSLAMEREMKSRGMNAEFRATGQTGIFIAGSGVPIDAIVGDFISGATEQLTPANTIDHWDIVEGQGSLFHPSYAGVSIGLLHGAQPDFLVLCHEPTRTRMRGLTHQTLPGILDCIKANEAAARTTNPHSRCIGVAVNTSDLTADEAAAYLKEWEDRLALPCVDPVRTGMAEIVDQLP